jgi:hypothetical protein
MSHFTMKKKRKINVFHFFFHKLSRFFEGPTLLIISLEQRKKIKISCLVNIKIFLEKEYTLSRDFLQANYL